MVAQIAECGNLLNKLGQYNKTAPLKAASFGMQRSAGLGDYSQNMFCHFQFATVIVPVISLVVMPRRINGDTKLGF